MMRYSAVGADTFAGSAAFYWARRTADSAERGSPFRSTGKSKSSPIVWATWVPGVVSATAQGLPPRPRRRLQADTRLISATWRGGRRRDRSGVRRVRSIETSVTNMARTRRTMPQEARMTGTAGK
jgi:hypothetical protein